MPAHDPDALALEPARDVGGLVAGRARVTRALTTGEVDADVRRRRRRPRQRSSNRDAELAGARGQLGHQLAGGDQRLARHAVGEHGRAADAVAVDDGDLAPRAALRPAPPRSRPVRRRGSPPGRWADLAVVTRSLCPIAAAGSVGTFARTQSAVPMTLYAAYGSNLDPRRMGERCPHSPLQGTGWLDGLAADLRRRGPRLGRRPRDGRRGHRRAGLRRCSTTSPTRTSPSSTAGRAPTPASTASSRCASRSSRRGAGLDLRARRLRGRPARRRRYLGIIADAAEAADAPDDYVAALRGRPCRSNFGG